MRRADRPLTPEEEKFYAGFTPMKIRTPLDDYGPDETLKVQITAEGHPHFGEFATVPRNSDGTITLIAIPGSTKPDMLKVKLHDCPHGVDACFVQEGVGNLRVLRKDHPLDHTGDIVRRRGRRRK